MPIDPSIPLTGRPAQIPGPMEMYSHLLGLQQQQQQMDLQKQSIGALAEQRQAQTQQSQLKLEAAQRQQAAEEAAMQAIAQIKGGNRDEVIGSIQDPRVRQMASEWLMHEDEFKSKMQSAKLENIRRGAQMIQAAGYDPVVARTVLGLKEEDYPEAKQIWETFGSDPDRFKQTIDQLSRAGEAPKDALSSEKTQAEIEHIKAQTEKTRRPDAPRTHVVQGIDPNTGQPATMIIADEVGAAVPSPPSQTQAQRPLVMGPGQTAINPQTGEPIAQIPATERQAETVPVQTMDPATGENVTQFVEKKPGQSFPAPRVLASLPIAKDNPMWVWRNGRPVRVKESEIQAGDSPAKPEQAADGKERIVQIIGPNNTPIWVRESQAVGQPAASRNAGVATKNVTSGDAGKLADFDTSLNELKDLKSTITGADTTGYAAKAGAMLPNAVTELTGWGAEAKSKQATIDRVKQVIGKTLEGGVLRKEDERKYEKILPTIGDPPAIVTAKLKGLESAIAQRKQAHLDALADAGYDISKFTARAAKAPAPKVGDKVGRFEIVGVK